jgi:phosphoglycerol transferase MdoB-like AlkP superfamily enzyme
MLTEKCPYCGSFNDIQAAECYFCHKQLPDVPGQPKKKRSQKVAPQTVTFSAPASLLKKKSPPGCLVLLSGVLVFLSILVVFQWINGAYKLTQWKIPALPTDTGAYISYYLAGLSDYINRIIQYPIPVIVTIGILVIFCWGMLNLRKWARTWALILLTILLIANFALFVFFVIHFYTTPENIISFCLILIGIFLNVYSLLWFFEHKKTFE